VSLTRRVVPLPSRPRLVRRSMNTPISGVAKVELRQI